MNMLESLLLGLLQGATEFLPVSSSGHLIMARQLIGVEEIPQFFDILLHMATLVAVIIVFRRRVLAILISLLRLIRRNVSDEDRVNLKMLLLIIIATVCTGVIGAGLSYLDVDQFPRIIAVLFIVTGLMLLSAKFLNRSRVVEQIGVKQAIITGIAQGLGVLPGISRSGITISAAIMSGVDREKAGEFSFLIALPAILGAALLKMSQAGDLMNVLSPSSLAVGISAAFLSGLFCLLLLIRLINKGKLFLFSFYLIPLGIVSLILL